MVLVLLFGSKSVRLASSKGIFLKHGWIFSEGTGGTTPRAAETQSYRVSALCPIFAFEVGQFQLILSSVSLRTSGLGLTERMW